MKRLIFALGILLFFTSAAYAQLGYAGFSAEQDTGAIWDPPICRVADVEDQLCDQAGASARIVSFTIANDSTARNYDFRDFSTDRIILVNIPANETFTFSTPFAITNGVKITPAPSGGTATITILYNHYPF